LPGAYTLIDAGSMGGGLGANTSGTIDGLPASLAISGNDLVLTVVPEAGTLALLGANAIGLLGNCVLRKVLIAGFAPRRPSWPFARLPSIRERR
jgi:hypothetical protein